MKANRSGLLSYAWKIFEKLALIAVTALIFLFIFPYSRQILIDNSFLDDDSIPAIAFFIMAFLIKSISEFDNKLEKIEKHQEKIIPTGAGAGHIYAILLETLKSKRRLFRNKSATFETLGLTLFTAWPAIEGWIKGGLTSCEFRLYCIDPDYLNENSSVFNPLWITDANTRIQEIQSFINDNKESLARNNISIELMKYKRFPAIHGFRISDSDIFISYANWGNNGKVENPHSFYEHFSSDDISARAYLYKELFSNWIKDAKAKSSITCVTATKIASSAETP